jgi:isoleucyl-tRNA synthetase
MLQSLDMEGNNQEKSNRALTEERILAFWQEQKVFEKTLQKDAPKGEYIFYEGPPTANAKPALHHLVSRAVKDVLPRYKTMQGYHVPRRAGWDTHGLPVELQIEKKLGLTSKKDIEQFGVAAFNKECKDSVFTFINDWEVFTERIGYWVDKKNAYYTFDTNYIESLWHIFSTVNNKGLVYKDFKVVPWCPRCGTGLSSHELAQPGAYVDVKELSVTAKFKVIGQENTYILAWTTTPWTLPGNVGLAVGEDIDYVAATKDGETLILAKERMEILAEGYIVTKEMKGKELTGLSYEPLYPYLKDIITGNEAEKMENAYKVYAADFVTTTDGTGVVHTAVMYGADDFDLGTIVGLPKFHTVDETGHFIKGTGFLEGRWVKDEEVAVDIIKDLAHRGLLFKKEKYEHSYPHCWRCKTALLYYARDSWYIGMSKLRDELVRENDSINWEPAHIKNGRFGEWLKDVKDWAISRERYWGTPLPIWQAADGERLFVDSIATLKQYIKRSGNTYTIMRHGQTEHNIKGLWNFGDHTDPLTDEGKKQVIATGAAMTATPDIIIASPYARTLETATLIASHKGMTEETIITDARLGEWNVGADFDGKPLDNYFTVRNVQEDRYGFKTADGESYLDIIKRAGDFLYDIETRYQGKNILIISHGAVTRALELIANGLSLKDLFEQTRQYKNFDNAELRTIDFAPLPHNEHYEIDLHRPFIDDVVLVKSASDHSGEAREFRRVKEVMDVWFDSGSMPFAQDHYPFDPPQLHSGQATLAYPADFISEAIDQTRGWFYTLHAIGVLMGRGKAYKNVICLGHILDAEGKKMSKSIGNIVDPWQEIDRFGVDTLRLWMYSVNQPGDSKNYDPKTVMELDRQVFGLLYNILSFYELYRDKDLEAQLPNKSENILDQWIMARLNMTIGVCTDSLDHYKLMEPVRAIKDLIGDLSTWYLRRSRDRLKDGDGRVSMDGTRHDSAESKHTLYVVLKTLAQLLAPFAPFAAEDIWLQLKNNNQEVSVHLSSWPAFTLTPLDEILLLETMITVRSICTIGNALRKKLAIPVRQPLQSITVKSEVLGTEYLTLIQDELNVKQVLFDVTLEEEAVLDTTITPALKAEGDYRELIRAVQDLRKAKGLTPSDVITITLPSAMETTLTPFMADFKKTVLAKEVSFTADNEEIIICL